MNAQLLIADPDQVSRFLLASRLEKAGYSVLEVGSEAEAIEKWGRAEPDLTIVDRSTPNRREGDLLRHIRNRFPARARLPVLLQLADHDPREIEGALASGVFYYLAKPYHTDLLLSVVRAALEERSSDEALQEAVETIDAALNRLVKPRFP